ncbi:unnamed protein product [Linum trigynum]|uniref:Uncharacterized protein n=1 Tax=Linum trigynum TaxID=586398 RepID=A0AAV2CA06_9ROSI
MRIAEAIGLPIRVDRATELGARGKFGRVCVEVDLTRSLLSQYKIEGVTYLIQYEGLDKVCIDCGTYGKATEACSCRDMTQGTCNAEEEIPSEPIPDPTMGRTFGEWMLVKRREWKPVRREETRRKTSMAADNTNRFQALHVTDIEVDTVAIDENETEGKGTEATQESVGEDVARSGKKGSDGKVKYMVGGELMGSGNVKKGTAEESPVLEGKGSNKNQGKNQKVVGLEKDTGKSKPSGEKVVNPGKSPGATTGSNKTSKGLKVTNKAEGAGNPSPLVTK